MSDSSINSRSSAELLGIVVDSNFTFHEHITDICPEAKQTLNFLTRLSNFINRDKRNLGIHILHINLVFVFQFKSAIVERMTGY